MEDTLDDLTHEASEHGVGVVVMGAPNDYETWEAWAQAERNDPDPSDLNDFLATQVTQEFEDQIMCWFRSVARPQCPGSISYTPSGPGIPGLTAFRTIFRREWPQCTSFSHIQACFG